MDMTIKSSKKQIVATISGQPYEINNLIQKINNHKIAYHALTPSIQTSWRR